MKALELLYNFLNISGSICSNGMECFWLYIWPCMLLCCLIPLNRFFSTGQVAIKDFVRPLILLGFTLLPFAMNGWLTDKNTREGEIKPKVLFIGVSLNISRITEDGIEGNWNTWDPIRKSLLKNKDLKEVILLVSRETLKENLNTAISKNKRLNGLKEADASNIEKICLILDG